MSCHTCKPTDEFINSLPEDSDYWLEGVYHDFPLKEPSEQEMRENQEIMLDSFQDEIVVILPC